MINYVIAVVVTALIGVLCGAIMIARAKRHANRVFEKVRADLRARMEQSPFPCPLDVSDPAAPSAIPVHQAKG